MKLISANPSSNYEVIGEVEISTEEQIRAKVQKAKGAAKQWKSLGVDKRVNLLRKVVNELGKRKEELALLETREMGMPITQTRQNEKRN